MELKGSIRRESEIGVYSEEKVNAKDHFLDHSNEYKFRYVPR